MFQSENARFNKAESVPELKFSVVRGETGKYKVKSLAPDGSYRVLTQYTGIGPNGEKVVEFYGVAGDANQTTTMLEVDPKDPRVGYIHIDSSVFQGFRFFRLRFRCMGVGSDGETLALFRGALEMKI